MRTRSQSREQRPPPPEGPPVVIEPLRIEYPFQEDPTVEPMADTRTMAQLLQAPTEGKTAHAQSVTSKNTSTMRVPNDPIATISLMLFHFSIEEHPEYAKKEPPRSIQTMGRSCNPNHQSVLPSF
ncbi:hypothetical protein Tco_0144271 [Tanacetum coccineum]